MFGYTQLKSILGTDVALSQGMIDAINEWKLMLDGVADWTGSDVQSLKIEQGICREFADTVLAEMETSISVPALDKIYKKQLTLLYEHLQDGLALGSFCLKPLPGGLAEFITADKFIPIQFGDNGRPTDVAFLTVKRIGEVDYYTRVERHTIANGVLTISNRCYHSQTQADIGQECSLEEVGEWQNIEAGPVSYPGMEQLDFGYYRNPLRNNVDASYCGVSVYESAKERIMKADVQAARLDWEYNSGERAIHVDERALKQKGGRFNLPRLSKRLYRGLNLEDGKDKELFREYSPEMRDEAFKRGLEEYKREIEFIVGLSYGDLSNVQNVEKTAEEIKSSKARKYNRVKAIQGKLRDCLEDFAAGLAFYNSMYTSGYEFFCEFSDSILTSEETERQQDRQDVNMGAMTLVEYRAKWYGETEEEAAKKIIDESVDPDPIEE